MKLKTHKTIISKFLESLLRLEKSGPIPLSASLAIRKDRIQQTYLTSNARAIKPAINGAATDVPVCLDVHPPYISAVT